jgi:hypothetical protein
MLKLQEARARSGRTQSAEIEHRLERSFDHEGLAASFASDDVLSDALARRFGKPLGPLLMVLGDLGQRVERLAEGLEDPDRQDGSPLLTKRGHDAYVRAVAELLQALTPGEGFSSASMGRTVTWDTVSSEAAHIQRAHLLTKSWPPSRPFTAMGKNTKRRTAK